MRWARSHHRSLEEKDARWLNRQAWLTPPTHLRGLPHCSWCHSGVFAAVGWGEEGEAWLLSFLSPQTPELPPPFQAQNWKGGNREC